MRTSISAHAYLCHLYEAQEGGVKGPVIQSSVVVRPRTAQPPVWAVQQSYLDA